MESGRSKWKKMESQKKVERGSWKRKWKERVGSKETRNESGEGIRIRNGIWVESKKPYRVSSYLNPLGVGGSSSLYSAWTMSIGEGWIHF